MDPSAATRLRRVRCSGAAAALRMTHSGWARRRSTDDGERSRGPGAFPGLYGLVSRRDAETQRETMTLPLLFVLASYLWGAIPASWVAGRLRGIDLRQHGSGNLGATNTFRVLGP